MTKGVKEMTKEARYIIDYLQNRRTKMPGFSGVTLSLLDEIKAEFCTIFCGEGFTLEGNQLELNHSGIELLENYFDYSVGDHAVTIENNVIVIGCKVFTVAFAKKLVKLYKDGVRTDNDSYSVQVKNINILAEASSKNIVITHDGFTCEGHTVSCDEVEKWIY